MTLGVMTKARGACFVYGDQWIDPLAPHGSSSRASTTLEAPNSVSYHLVTITALVALLVLSTASLNHLIQYCSTDPRGRVLMGMAPGPSECSLDAPPQRN